MVLLTLDHIIKFSRNRTNYSRCFKGSLVAKQSRCPTDRKVPIRTATPGADPIKIFKRKTNATLIFSAF